MKKQKTKLSNRGGNALVFLSMIICFMFNGCEDEGNMEESIALPSFQVVTLNDLPVAVRSGISTVENSLKSVVNYKDNLPFGAVRPERVHQRHKPDGSVSYTLGLTRESEDLYYDNLVISQDAQGNLKTHIVRYRPESSWFYKHKTEGLGYEQYSGTITVFGETGTLLSSVTLISGQPEKEAAETTLSKVSAESSCEILDVQYVGGCAGEDYCWWSEIIITVDCTGTGGGSDYEDDGMNDGFNDPGGEEGGSAGPGGGGTGGNTNDGPGEPIDTVPVEEMEDIIIVGPENPIANINDYLECFDITQGAAVTIYVDQPIANSDAIASTSDKAGHAFISISQNNNTSVFGFYPAGNATPFNPSGTSVMGDDSNHEYDVSISKSIDGNTLQAVLNHAINYPSSYDLNDYNCTDFVIEIGNMLEMNLPDCYSSWGIGGGSNPAKLGQYIRNDFNSDGTYLINENGGNAPSNNKGC